MSSGFLNSKIFCSEIDQERDQRHLIFFRYPLRSSSGWFKIQKFCSSSEIDQERDPKTFIFFQIELWVRYFFVFRSSSELVSKFKNSVLVQKSIKSAIQRLLMFFRLSYGFVIFLFSDRALVWFLNSKILF